MSVSPQSPYEPPTPGSHYQPALSVMLIIIALFVGSAFLILRSPGVAQTNAVSPSTTISTPATSGTTTTVVTKAKAQVRVQLANGTSVTGLARTYTQQLMTLGWDTLPQLNSAPVSATIVYYNPGYLWAAQQIAAAIKVRPTAIRPLNGQNPVAGSSGDDVIVILGLDASTALG